LISTEPTPGDPPVRADKRRNRDKLVVAARAAFAAADDAPLTMERIARAAGVGVGTLYRHFPTREALVEAVYAAELDDVVTSVPALLADLAPVAALRAWMDRYAAFVATKRGMIDMLHAARAAGKLTTPATRERITAAVGDILAEGVRAGEFRADVDAGDVTTMILGVLVATANPDASAQTDRLLDLVIDALRPTSG
jgi:AcrR family transcriptional regulator